MTMLTWTIPRGMKENWSFGFSIVFSVLLTKSVILTFLSFDLNDFGWPLMNFDVSI